MVTAASRPAKNNDNAVLGRTTLTSSSNAVVPAAVPNTRTRLTNTHSRARSTVCRRAAVVLLSPDLELSLTRPASLSIPMQPSVRPAAGMSTPAVVTDR